VLSELRKLACASAKVRKGIAKTARAPVPNAVGRNLDRLGKAGLATIPVAAGVQVAQKSKDRFDPANTNAMMGLHPGQ
jgi:hypothetical protein